MPGACRQVQWSYAVVYSNPVLELSGDASGLGNLRSVACAVQAGMNGAGVGAYKAAPNGSSCSSAPQQVRCQGTAASTLH